MITVPSVGLAFNSVFLAAFHTPSAHRLPVAVVASDQAAALFDAKAQRLAPEAYQFERYADETSARSAVEHRDAYAAYLFDDSTPKLVYAGANGPAVTALVTPLAALPNGDTRPRSRTSSPCRETTAGVCRSSTRPWVWSWQVFSPARSPTRSRRGCPSTRGAEPRTLRGARRSCHHSDRLYGLWCDIPGSFFGIFAIVTLLAGAVVAPTVALIRTFGAVGVPLNSIYMLIVGNATSGGVLPPSFFPSWLQPLAFVMPSGVGVRAHDGLAYFHHDGLGSGVVILSAWIAVCVGVLYVLDRIAASTGIVHAANR